MKKKAGAVDALQINWQDPKEARAYLEAASELAKLLAKGGGGREWRTSVENIGMLFLDDSLYAAIHLGRDLIAAETGLTDVYLLDLMTHADCKMKFVSLVCMIMQRIDLQKHSRMTSPDERREVDESIRQLVRFKFRRLYYDADDILRFLDEDDPVGRSSREARVARRSAYTAATGRYFSDAGRYSDSASERAASAGILSGRGSRVGKKPGPPLETPQEARDRRLLEHLRQ